MEFEVARALAQTVVSCPAFETASEETIARAAETMLSCGTVLAAFDPGKQKDNPNVGLLETARQHHMSIVFSARELQ